MDRSRLLIYCPASPQTPGVHPQTLESIMALEWDQPFDIVFGKDGGNVLPGSPEGNRNITNKYNHAREIALGGYDALMTIEADMIVPPNAIERLLNVDADIAYGLYVSRHGPHPWLAFERVTPEIKGSKSMGETWEERDRMMGCIIESQGVGLGCTLIHRPVLEAIQFRLQDEYVANDWYFAVDARANGFKQAHHCGVICGHIDGYQTYWPDVAHGYRVDEPPALDIEELMGMANGKYIVVRTLSMGSYHAYPGDEVELDDATAKILLKKKVIKPAKVRRVKSKEISYGTDN